MHQIISRFAPVWLYAFTICLVDSFSPATHVRFNSGPVTYRPAQLVGNPHHFGSIALLSSCTPSETCSTSATAHSCNFCAARFSSRNALFRHVRAVHDTENVLPTRQSVTFHFGYMNISHTQAGALLCDAFVQALPTSKLKLLSTTQTSIARAKTQALSQEENTPSALDMLVLSYMAPLVHWHDSQSMGDHHVTTVAMVLDAIRETLRGSGIEVHGMRVHGTTDRSLHAEQSCSQHIYHFLLPLSWLPDREDVRLSLGKSTAYSSQSLRSLKRILRSVESERLEIPKQTDWDQEGSAESSSTTTATTTSPRFGLLRYRAKRPWHNFADPSLRGSASPNNLDVWRIVDRARILGWTEKDSKKSEMNNESTKVGSDETQDQVFLIVEFRGDQFLQQQIRRTIAAAVAMTHGWLPEDYMDQATDAKIFIETPLAPKGLMYRAGSRHHGVEMYRKGRKLFDWDDVVRARKDFDPINWMQQKLIHENWDVSVSNEWLKELRETVAPRICAQLHELSQAKQYDRPFSVKLAPAPDVYQPVLQMLRDIVVKQRWPSTTNARASVILGELSAEKQAGSFTVVSEQLVKEHDSECTLPLGNALFPELTEAVFKLEEGLSAGTGRPPSTHCAINCNAQFTPHVDSGRGSGQSVSMIVALGDFTGGELMIEGQPYDIRYLPMEFDGWKLRHWTRSFAGERFSLVWFTPEM